MADLESTGVVAGREGHAEIHEGLEIDGAMSTRQAVQGTPKLALERFDFDTERERTELHELATFRRPTYLKQIDNDGVVSLLVKTPCNVGRLSVLVSRVVGVLNVATLQHL